MTGRRREPAARPIVLVAPPAGPLRRPAKAPCVACPYRVDAPSGLWAVEEYAKLTLYDLPTGEQPTGVFQCHEANRRVCAGWAGCHDGDELLALRMAVPLGTLTLAEAQAVRAYVSPVPLWGSGYEAAAHGLADIADPGEEAGRIAARLIDKRGR